MNESEWRTRKERIDTKLRNAFVQKITGNANVDRPLQRIREFRNRPNPKVVVTVDMLSTGVDIPALEFIVFLRPVKSRILWVQMLGHGTRKCPDLQQGEVRGVRLLRRHAHPLFPEHVGL